jgi:hypothetical protein
VLTVTRALFTGFPAELLGFVLSTDFDETSTVY